MVNRLKVDVRDVAAVLSGACDIETLGRLLNCLLCCDAEPALCDREAAIGEHLFDALSDLRPDAVKAAMDGAMGGPVKDEAGKAGA